jgi:hypothetical protein
MKFQHWIGCFIVLAIGYFIGAKWPMLAQKVTG